MLIASLPSTLYGSACVVANLDGQFDTPGKRDPHSRTASISLARGHICRAFSQLVTDVGVPSSRWAVSPLGLWVWAV